MASRSPANTRTFVLVVGARPNLVKAAPLLRVLDRQRGVRVLLVHTGQHYDDSMSGIFLRQLGIRAPDAHLRVGGGTHAVQTARVMVRFEVLLRKQPVDRVLVVGDVNSTLGAALVATKLCIPVDHIEAGLRCGDRRMPEEINRIATDSIASRYFASEPSGVTNLLREGCNPDAIHHVGNLMIDSLARVLPAARRRRAWQDFGLSPGSYAVATLHRPANVDDNRRLARLVDTLREVGRSLPVVFPVHPRTAQRLGAMGSSGTLRLTPPLGYPEFQSLLAGSRVAITDSGGIQEETTALGIPCLTLRDSTERPITVQRGTNTLIGSDMELLQAKVHQVLNGRYKRGRRPSLWDGKSAQRIKEVLLSG